MNVFRSDQTYSLASPEQVAEFEGPPTGTPKVRITCGPCVWSIHTKVFTARCHHGPLGRCWYGHERKEQEIELVNDGVFIFARILQFLYYGTYSSRSDDMIAAEDNIARPGQMGISPAMIVRSGLSDPSDPSYMHMKLQDDAISQDFGHEVHLALFKSATKYEIRDLELYSLNKYSTYPFRNYREFYYSVIDQWPQFPDAEYWSGDYWISRAVIGHIARFWKEVKMSIDIPPREEARQIVSWVEGEGVKQKILMELLMLELAGIDIDEQQRRENPCLIEDCKKCGGPSKEEWSDSETDRSAPY